MDKKKKKSQGGREREKKEALFEQKICTSRSPRFKYHKTTPTATEHISSQGV
jgi:hypothetical protein